MSRCMIDMGEFPEPFYYPIQRVVTYGKPYWPSYSVWMAVPQEHFPFGENTDTTLIYGVTDVKD